MAFQIRLERWKVMEYRDGCVYNTKKLSDAESEWFPVGAAPATNMPDADGKMWVVTNDYRIFPPRP